MQAASQARAFYSFAFNGFLLANPSSQQLRALRADRRVAAVTRDAHRRLLTTTTPSFLHLDAPNGIWQALGSSDGSRAGASIVIGLLDSGVWPEHPSFAAAPDLQPPPGWGGACVDGEEFDAASACSAKLVGCRFFLEGFSGNASAIKEAFPYERISCRLVGRSRVQQGWMHVRLMLLPAC